MVPDDAGLADATADSLGDLNVGGQGAETDVDGWLLEGAPERLLCPVSFVLMRDPVLVPDGHTYQREALQGCFDYAVQRKFCDPALMLSA